MSLEELYEAMTPGQRRFADIYIRDYEKLARKEVNYADIYEEAFPNVRNRNEASQSAWRLIRGRNNCRNYLNEALKQHGVDTSSKIRTDDEVRLDLEAMATADITEIVSWKVVEQEDGGTILIPNVLDVNEVDPVVRRLIKSITWTKNGPKLELHDQLRAQDMLNRMRGAYVDKLELSGPGGGAIKIENTHILHETVAKLLADM